MAIRLKLNGVEIETDSPEEAVEMYRHLSAVNGHTAASRPVEPRQNHQSKAAPAGTTLKTISREVVRLLLSHKDGEETTIIAEKVGAKSAKGLSYAVHDIKTWAKTKFGLTDDDIITRELKANAKGETVSYLRLHDALVQKLKGCEKEFLGNSLI